MLKIYTANFYQVRNFEPNMIPFSTAKGEPAWYHDNKDRSNIFVDKRNVINGLVAEPFQFDESLLDSVPCAKHCLYKPPDCPFMQAYRKSIDKFTFDYIIDYLSTIAENSRELNNFKGEPVIVLLVYEHPSCACAERPVIQQYFKDHGYVVQEWAPDLAYKVDLF